jgi:hypothetical protein
MSWFTDARDAVESAAVVVGNYLLPGSSLLTSKWTSEGSQEQLNSDLGIVAQLISSAAGLGMFGNAGSPLFGGGIAAPTPGTAPVANAGSDAFASANAAPFSSANPDVSAYTSQAARQTGGIINANASSSALQTTAKPGVWDKIGTFLDKPGNAVAVGMGLQGTGAIMSGMGASEQARVARDKQEYERQQYERGLRNINAPVALPFNIKPYAPVTRTRGIINARGVA